LNFISGAADVDVNCRILRLKNWAIRQVRLLMLAFNCVVSNAGVDVLTVNANAHDTFPLARARTQGVQKHLDSSNVDLSCRYLKCNLEGSSHFFQTVTLLSIYRFKEATIFAA
jgi:hypothetical protein